MTVTKEAAAAVAVLVLAACAGTGGNILAPRLAGTGMPSSFLIQDVPFYPQTAHHCGPASLATVLVFSGAATSPDTLVPMVYLPGRRGSLAVEMTAAVRRMGRMPYRLDGTLESLIAEVAGGRPAAVLLNLGIESLPRWHYAVVVGYDGSRDMIVLRSGKTREKTIAASQFRKQWKASGFWAIVVVAPGEAPATAEKVPFFRQAAALESAGMPGQSEAAWRRAALLWPDSPIPHLGIGNALAAQGRLDEAETAFRSLVSEHPGNVRGQNNLAHVLSLRGCHEEALAITDRLLRQGAGTGFEDMVSQTHAEILTHRENDNGGGDCPGQSSPRPNPTFYPESEP